MISITSPEDGHKFASTDDVVISGKGGPVATYKLSKVVGGTTSPTGLSATLTNNPDGTWSLDFGTLAAGNYSITVTDSSGNSATIGFSVSG